jgi:hypothetical protein
MRDQGSGFRDHRGFEALHALELLGGEREEEREGERQGGMKGGERGEAGRNRGKQASPSSSSSLNVNIKSLGAWLVNPTDWV